MAVHVQNITFDCDDTAKVGAFWSAALDRALDPSPNEHIHTIGMTDGMLPRWFFLKVPEGKTAKNRMHLDLGTDDREKEVERLLDLGATHVADKDEWGIRWTVLQDPEGNEFCVSSGTN